ncbi:acyl-CoA dehydrogenase family protein [Streptomyces sp. NPDC101776]|uniref:acyl-CoA dehydrogenase family protein n=1 Tax=Streptomyces sp. NPDC101776 TaxID=3366146 RepID=UPI0037F90760
MATETPAPTLDGPPEVSPEALVERAAGLRDLIREQADEAEELGHYTPEVHEAFKEAGFYHLLTPKRYGGLDVDVRTFARVMMEVGRADPGTAWCLCLGQGHGLSTAANWPKQAQDEVFTNALGYFRASQSLSSAGTAQRVEGGWLINAKSPYQSGSAYASHVTVTVKVVDEKTADETAGNATSAVPSSARAGAPLPPGGPGRPGLLPSAPEPMLHVLIPAGQFEIQDDWGGDAVFGMRSSGSNTVVVKDQVVPEYYGVYGDFMELAPDTEHKATSPGLELHGNPLYLPSVHLVFFAVELASSVIGAARAALDESEKLARTKITLLPRMGPRYKDTLYQRDFGQAMMKADSAEAIMMHACDLHAQWCRDDVENVRPYTTQQAQRVGAMMVEAAESACQTVDILFRSAGTSASGRGQRMQRYLRDVSMYRTHIATQYHTTAQRLGESRLDPVPFPPAP